MALGHIFGNNVGNDFGLLVRRRIINKPDFAHDIVPIHTLMLYTDLIEYNTFSGTKDPLLRCFIFIAKLKAGCILTTGQYKNYQTFINL